MPPKLKRNSDRFNKRPGGSGLANALHQELAKSTTPTSTPTGLGDALTKVAGLAEQHGLTVVDVQVATLAPHPLNDPSRSKPQPGNPKWDELVESVRENGVKLPCLVVTREAFVAARPDLTDKIPESLSHVAVYGHRRRAAAVESQQSTLPAIVDDSVLENGGDLDAMTWENWGREDPDPISLAHQFALYSEDLKLGQRGIAARLGVSQPTVSRHLALMLLTEEGRDLVRQEQLSLVAAADLASKLPYGPVRRWQDTKKIDPDQDSDERASDQRAALELISGGMTVDQAAARVIAERKARVKAASLDVELVDPAQRFGPDHETHRIAALPDDRTAAPVVAAVDPYTGNLRFYAEQVPSPSGEAADSAAVAPAAKSKPERVDSTKDATHEGDAKERAEAQKLRRQVTAILAARGTSRERLGLWLTNQFRWRVRSSDNARAWTLAHRWLVAAGVVSTVSVEAWQASIETEEDPKAVQRAVWAVALAAAEIRASDKGRAWDGGDAAYLDLLREYDGFTPTEWESQQLQYLDSQK